MSVLKPSEIRHMLVNADRAAACLTLCEPVAGDVVGHLVRDVRALATSCEYWRREAEKYSDLLLAANEELERQSNLLRWVKERLEEGQ